jgi:hypothetical protein
MNDEQCMTDSVTLVNTLLKGFQITKELLKLAFAGSHSEASCSRSMCENTRITTTKIVCSVGW